MSREFWIDPDDRWAADNDFGKNAIHVREVTDRDQKIAQAVQGLVEAARHYSKWLEQNGHGTNTALHRHLAAWERVNEGK